jgi:hypothetical protein
MGAGYPNSRDKLPLRLGLFSGRLRFGCWSLPRVNCRGKMDVENTSVARLAGTMSLGEYFLI